ncbi:unnamed protein product [Candidula unifasciata]|uniref:Uncharacterized protein n=1 Tax=Candidula unifasciata TaxID=100452 RepID=A0A8S4A7H6_9EUPU|nr:unnamed protein product [Candidula unifasciata]
MDDSFIKESCKSYQKCHIANSARRNSLTKKTIGIEFERKLASHQLDREERQLREHLKFMKMEQAKSITTNGIRDKPDGEPRQRKSGCQPVQESRDNEFIDPYPVTFASVGSSSPTHRQRSQTMVEKGNLYVCACARVCVCVSGLLYAARRYRRISKEFEDLCLNTTTGKLAIPTHILLHPFMSFSTSSTSQSSSPLRKASSSRSSLDSVEASHWPGDPEAIHSIRRPRKSVEQQDKERVMRMIVDMTNN